MLTVIVYSLIFLSVVGLDQLTKALVDGGADITIIKGVLYISSTHNTGAAFSMLGNASWAQTFFLVLTVIAVSAATAYLFFNKKKSKWLDISIILILAGAIGNFIDRVALKYVRDFIYVTFFANFNVADTAITVGAIMLVVYLFFLDPEAIFKPRKKAADGERVESEKETEKTGND